MRFAATWGAAALAAGLVFTPTGQAQEAPSVATASASTATRVTIPFAPVLGKPMRFRVEKADEESGRASAERKRAYEGEDVITFAARNADGYLLHWTTTSGKYLGEGQEQEILNASASVMIGNTINIQTDHHGKPLRITNIPEMRERLRSSLAIMVASIDKSLAGASEETRVAKKKLAGAMAQSLVDMPDDQFNDTFLLGPRMMFGFGGRTMVLGRAEPVQKAVMVPFVNGELTLSGTTTLRREAASGLTLETSIRGEPGAFRALVMNLIERMVSNQSAAEREQALKQFAGVNDIDYAETTTVTLNHQSGMPTATNVTTRITAMGQEQVSVNRYTALD